MLSNENFEDILNFAKFQPNSFNRISQTILFDEDYNKDGSYIFKVNDDILNNLNGKNSSQPILFSIKGKDNETAVLCTEDKSYEIRESETSNTLLIVPNIELDFTTNENESFITKRLSVSSTCNKFFEVNIRKAKMGEVFKILQHCILYHHIEYNENKQLYNFVSLLDEVKMSEQELQKIMCDLKVYTINGNLRLLYIDYIYDIVLKIIECSYENDFSIWKISQNNVHLMLDDLYPRDILDQTLSFFFERISENEGDIFWKVKEIEVTKCFAEFILNNSNEMDIDDFLNIWKQQLPDELSGNIDDLNGLIIKNEYSQHQTVKLLKSVTLSDEPDERFKELFSLKPYWFQEELEGFINDIVPINSSASQLIMKFCRCTNNGKIKTFSKR